MPSRPEGLWTTFTAAARWLTTNPEPGSQFTSVSISSFSKQPSRRLSNSASFIADLRPSNDTAVQRRPHEGAKRPTRLSDCNGRLAAAPRLQCFRHARGEIFVVLTKGADERRLKVEVGDQALREVADATFPV